MNSNDQQKWDGDGLKVAIKEDQITVAPEGRTIIQVGIHNASSAEDRINILVSGLPSEWIIIDTPTFHLAAGETKLVTLTIQPSTVASGHVVQYPLNVHVVSQIDPRRSTGVRAVVTVAAYQSRGRIGVMLSAIHFSLVPGTSITIPILLQNRGDEVDDFRLRVTGLPVHWISYNSTPTRLEPGASEEVLLTLQIPRSPQAAAGRRPITIQIVSQTYASQTVEVEAILTIAAFSEFTASLEPGSIQAGQAGQVNVENKGNTIDTYSLSFQSPGDELIFEKAVQVTRQDPRTGSREAGIIYVNIPQEDKFQVPAGENRSYSFRTRLRTRPIIGGERTYPFTTIVRSTGKTSTELNGQVVENAYIPSWIFLPAGLIGCLFLCLVLLIPLRNLPTSARATQTASVNQTQAALSGEADPDGDGLTNDREAALGTDPLQPDTDGDRLLDREEVETHLTDPLDPDTDGDGLQDGDEIQTYQTDPRQPDTDGDGLSDGDEIRLGTDPRNPDTDGDGLRDGDEIRLEANPRNPDSDNDGLRDGEENSDCPRPNDPDSDDDGIIDSRDLDPCNPSNPALTATAAAAAAQATAAAPTITSTPTLPPTITPTLTPPSLTGVMVFSSDRDGNAEIYALNLANLSAARLTNNSAQDVQPALAPDSVQIAYVSNQNGNNEIYLIGVSGGIASNLTNNVGDDQQPTWSPDGNWIAFTTNRDGNQEIYIMQRDGSELRNLTNNPASDFAPTWFSSGGVEWIAFTSMRDGNQEVYKVRPDGTGLTNLTQNPANDHSPAGFIGGTILAFVSDRNGNWDIYTMNDMGGSITNITNNPAQDIEPAFNPDGNWISFTTNREGNLEIYFVGRNGGTAFNLTKSLSQDRDSDW